MQDNEACNIKKYQVSILFVNEKFVIFKYDIVNFSEN